MISKRNCLRRCKVVLETNSDDGKHSRLEMNAMENKWYRISSIKGGRKTKGDGVNKLVENP